EDRIIGTSNVVSAPVQCLWMATGNNPILAEDIARRTVRIRLDTQTERPYERAGFRHPNLMEWVADNRPTLIWAALVLIRAWIAEACPAGAANLGMFESWSRVMGGILEVTGIPGFLANRKATFLEDDPEGVALKSFVEVWWHNFGSR